MMERDEVTPLPSARVLHEWTVRAGNEYGSGVIAHHLTLRLLQVGAPPELIRAGMDVVQDELRHAEACRTLLHGLGHDAPPVLAREHLEIQRQPGDPLEHDLVRACIGGFCIDETLAVTLFKVMRHSASVPAIVELAGDFLRDEVHHRELGWVTLEWLLHGPQGDELRAVAEQAAPTLLTRRGNSLCDPTLATRVTPPTASERAWGILSREQYAEVFAVGCARDVLPRFRGLGVEIDEGVVEEIVGRRALEGAQAQSSPVISSVTEPGESAGRVSRTE
jgi:hypothetical protein